MDGDIAPRRASPIAIARPIRVPAPVTSAAAPAPRAALVRLAGDGNDLASDGARVVARQKASTVAHDLVELDEGLLSPICATLSAVRTVAGATAFTRMSASWYSRASSRVSPATADFAAL
jgi:hypothetical protein